MKCLNISFPITYITLPYKNKREVAFLMILDIKLYDPYIFLEKSSALH